MFFGKEIVTLWPQKWYLGPYNLTIKYSGSARCSYMIFFACIMRIIRLSAKCVNLFVSCLIVWLWIILSGAPEITQISEEILRGFIVIINKDINWAFIAKKNRNERFSESWTVKIKFSKHRFTNLTIKKNTSVLSKRWCQQKPHPMVTVTFR